MRRCASLYSETTPSVSVDRCGVCGEAWWRAPERAWLPPCHTPVGSGVPACEVDSTLHTRGTYYVPPPRRGTLWSRFAVISAVVGDADGLAGDSLIPIPYSNVI